VGARVIRAVEEHATVKSAAISSRSQGARRQTELNVGVCIRALPCFERRENKAALTDS